MAVLSKTILKKSWKATTVVKLIQTVQNGAVVQFFDLSLSQQWLSEIIFPASNSLFSSKACVYTISAVYIHDVVEAF